MEEKKIELLSKKKRKEKNQNNISNTVLNNTQIPKVCILTPASSRCTHFINNFLKNKLLPKFLNRLLSVSVKVHCKS